MITSTLNQEQINKSIELLNMIRTDEGELFYEYVNGNYEKPDSSITYVDVKFFDDGENTGIFTSMIIFGLFRVFIAFKKDTDKYIRDLSELIISASKKNPGFKLKVFFIAEQTKIIEGVKNTLKFRPPNPNGFYYASHEFVMDKEHFKGFINDKQLEILPYEANKINDYALLLDKSMTFSSPPANFQGSKENLVEQIRGNAFSAFYKDDELVGVYWLDDDFYTIDIIAVAPEHQRKGYGNMILSHAINNVLTVLKRHTMAKLYCVDWNEKGLAFYKKYGMILKGHSYVMDLAE
jgi:GNAT superfamily N-acetyltransferase